MSEIQNAEKEAEAMSADSINHLSDSSQADTSIWPPSRKKRRRRLYLSFAKVAEAFPDTSTDVVGQLAEMEVIKPSNVVKLVTQATLEQIVSFLQAEEINDNWKEAAGQKENILKPGGGISQLH